MSETHAERQEHGNHIAALAKETFQRALQSRDFTEQVNRASYDSPTEFAAAVTSMVLEGQDKARILASFASRDYITAAFVAAVAVQTEDYVQHRIQHAIMAHKSRED